MDSYDWFKDLVAKRRSLAGEELATVADGRVFTGRQAIKLKLIDQLGDEQTAIAWLAKEKGIDPTTPVRNYSLRPRFSEFSFIHLSAVSLLNAMGLDGFARSLEQSGAFAAAERLNLDGLLALWHPSPVN
jgi:protease-4